MNIENILKKFIVKELMNETDIGSLSNDKPLIAGGIIDSAGLIQLVTFIEEQFEINVTDNDLVPENFESIDNLLRLIKQKRK